MIFTLMFFAHDAIMSACSNISLVAFVVTSTETGYGSTRPAISLQCFSMPGQPPVIPSFRRMVGFVVIPRMIPSSWYLRISGILPVSRKIPVRAFIFVSPLSSYAR